MRDRGFTIGDRGYGIRGFVIRFAAAVVACAFLFAPLGAAAPADRVWFCPGPGTIDYLRLFEHPEEWPHARQLFDVFKFYQQHTQTPAPAIVGPNSYDAFVRAGAFQTLTKWGKKIAIEAGSVKEFYCTPDASGMNASIQQTLDSLRAVQSAGGTVSYIAQDDPFASGRAPQCGGPALEPTADRIATYAHGVQSAFPAVKIGLIEAYPLSSEATIETILGLLAARGVPPAFVHADVDSRALRLFRADFTRDMRALRDACAARGIPFGIIIWGYNGDSDALYAVDAEHVLAEITDAFTSWSDMPDHIIVQSWAVSSTGLLITPSNLPEDRLYTHTNLMMDVYRRVRGQTAPSTGTAVTRR
jgi:hypothetical protein